MGSRGLRRGWDNASFVSRGCSVGFLRIAFADAFYNIPNKKLGFVCCGRPCCQSQSGMALHRQQLAAVSERQTVVLCSSSSGNSRSRSSLLQKATSSRQKQQQQPATAESIIGFPSGIIR